MNYQKNIEILNRLEKSLKAIKGECSVIFEIKGRDEKLTEVSKEEFARWMVNEKNKDSWVGGVFSLKPKNPEIGGQKNEFGDKKQVEKPKESLVYGVKWDVDGSTYFTERKGKDRIVEESYYEPRSEEDKKRILEQGKKKREQEVQKENLSNSNKKDQQSEKGTKQQNFSQTLDNKNNNKNVYCGICVVSLILLLISAIVVSTKKRKLK